MYSIDLIQDSIIFDDVLIYIATFDDIKHFSTEGIRFDPLHTTPDNKYIVNCKLGPGEYDLVYDEEKIHIKYDVDYSNPVGLSHIVKCNELLTLSTEKSKDLLEDFIKKAYLHSKPKKKNMIDVTIFKNYWSKLNKLPKRSIDTVYLDKEVKDGIINDIEEFIEDEAVYNQFGIPYKRTYLLEGTPGTGKTSLIFALASKLDMNISIFNFGPDVDDAIFMKAISTLPENSILLLEDVDALFVNRDSKSRSYITFSGILNTLDGVSRRHKLITFITTNYVDKLDSALMRPGRIDYIVHFDHASKEQIELMFNNFRPDDDTFEEFYDKIKNTKFTTAILQKFFFKFRKEKSVINKVKELNDIKNMHSHKTDQVPEFMYM